MEDKKLILKLSNNINEQIYILDYMKALVVYYSRTGNTREVATRIADELGCDIEEIHDTQKRTGILGFIKSGYQAARGKDTVLEPYEKDPYSYDLVIAGTPVWAGKPSVPISTYLKENRSKIKRVAFFCTYGGSGAEGTFRTMKEILGMEPIETVAITEKEIKEDKCDCKIEPFVRDVEEAFRE